MILFLIDCVLEEMCSLLINNKTMDISICAILITFYPSSQVLRNINKIKQQIQNLIIIDNTPGKNPTETIKYLIKNSSIHVIKNNQNKGMAKALNQGIDWAEQQGFRWVVTFDQDTEVMDNFLETIILSLSQYHTPELIAAIGANYIIRNSSHIGISVKSNNYYFETKDVITSGCLLSIDIVRKIGGFDDKLFIDMVDTDICIRARIAGYKILITTKPIMYHSIGNPEIRHLFGKKFTVTNHAPFRRYFIFRNTIYLAKKFFWNDTKWSLEMLFTYLPKVFIKACIFENKKIINMWFIFRGIFDGLFSRFDENMQLE